MIDIKKKAAQAARFAQDELLGTLRNMSPKAVGDRYRAVDQARADEGSRMIRENFGNEDNYRKTLGLDTPEGKDLFTPPYAKVMQSFADRLAKARQMISK